MFKLSHTPVSLPDLQLPETLTVRGSLDRVLRLPSVASKRYLTNKVWLGILVIILLSVGVVDHVNMILNFKIVIIIGDRMFLVCSVTMFSHCVRPNTTI